MQNKTQKQIIKVARLLNLVSPTEIQSYVDKYNADFSANKLHSIIFLKLFLYCWVLDRSSLSLRTIAQYSQSQIFRELAHLDEDFSVGKTALSKRLTKIPYRLFQDLFEHLAEKTLAVLPNNQRYSDSIQRLIKQSHILDSTIITLSAKLLKAGFQINEGQLTIKASMAIHGRQIPIKALVFTDKKYSSEEEALPELFDFSQKNVIYIFDRGVKKLKTYADIVASGNHFLSRLSNQKYEAVSVNEPSKENESATITVIKDEVIVFPNLKSDKQHRFRLITAQSKKDRKILKFVTTLSDISATDITDLYRYRWSIEIFFRFLKGALHLESLLSYSENGMKVHIYLTLMAFLLTWNFKEQNNIKSFKRAREQLKWILLEILMKQQFQQGLLTGAALHFLLDTS